MLVLTRKRSEMIQIGDNIVLKIIQTGRNSVKIGIEAPSNVRVLRAELCEEPPVVEPPRTVAPTAPGVSLTLADRLKMRRGGRNDAVESRSAAVPTMLAVAPVA
jgi:carbon storage regulator